MTPQTSSSVWIAISDEKENNKNRSLHEWTARYGPPFRRRLRFYFSQSFLLCEAYKTDFAKKIIAQLFRGNQELTKNSENNLKFWTKLAVDLWHFSEKRSQIRRQSLDGPGYPDSAYIDEQKGGCEIVKGREYF